nr:MAG TPA: hypothetical protein [Caudoviricetes sp.]
MLIHQFIKLFVRPIEGLFFYFRRWSCDFKRFKAKSFG